MIILINVLFMFINLACAYSTLTEVQGDTFTLIRLCLSFLGCGASFMAIIAVAIVQNDPYR